jgi:hypothetical protein
MRPKNADEWINTLKLEIIPWTLEISLVLLGASLAHQDAVVLGWLAAEVSFLAYCARCAQVLNAIRPETETSLRTMDQLWDLCLSSVPDARDFFCGWFFGAPIESITRDDAISFLSWAQFGTLPELLDAPARQDILRLLRTVETRLGLAFPPRSAGAPAPLPCMRFSLEPLRWTPKPLLFYAACAALRAAGAARLRALGFTPATVDRRAACWVRMPATVEGRARVPVVFAHGLGVGLVTYARLLAALVDMDAPVIAVELPHLAMTLDPRPRGIDETVAGITALLDRLGYDRALLAGHSYGSLVVSWMAQRAPDRVAGAFFVDPVTFQLHERDILYNFLYRHPGPDPKVCSCSESLPASVQVYSFLYSCPGPDLKAPRACRACSRASLWEYGGGGQIL